MRFMEEYELEADRRIGADVRPQEVQSDEGDRRVDVQDRRSPRRRTLKGVRISFNNEYSFVDAVLRNLSETGCYIELPDGYLIPDSITIHNDLDGYKVDCEVVRRQGKRIGVKFIEEKIPVEIARKQVLNVIDFGQPEPKGQEAVETKVTPQTKSPQRRKGPVFGKLGTPR